MINNDLFIKIGLICKNLIFGHFLRIVLILQQFTIVFATIALLFPMGGPDKELTSKLFPSIVKLLSQTILIY
jgi:hypothetical protein